MTNITTSIRAFGTYLLLAGFVLLAYPAIFTSLLGAPAETAPWLRLLGVALWALAYYYFRAAGSGNPASAAGRRDFFTWSVHVRIGQFVLLVILVTLGLISPLILFPSAFEFATAVWTWFSLKAPAEISIE